MGVDLFFCLSGFLITSRSLSEWKNTRTIDLKNFYVRRLWLFPAMAVMIVLCFLYELFIWKVLTTGRLKKRAVVPLLYLTNWSRAFAFPSLPLYEHTWSLGVEEQFYLIWPPVLLLLLKAKTNPKILICTALTTLIGCINLHKFYLVKQGRPFYRLYNGFDIRADALLVGCLLLMFYHFPGMINRGRSKLILCLSSLPALWLIANLEPFGLIFYRGVGPFIFLFFAAFIYRSALEDKSKLLRSDLLVWFGRLSYSIYLFQIRFSEFSISTLRCRN